nr:integrase, catalytic region, zinc finger, CCHC-type, peptidase aspartic, catalytic [Tanacetum cinerariifolium]
MYVGEMLYNVSLKIDSLNSEETLEDAEESQLTMRNKMHNGSESKDVPLESLVLKMPKESRLLKMIDSLAELKKSSSDSKDIQANLLKRIKILENDFKRSQAQSIDFELKWQHQKEKMACDVVNDGLNIVCISFRKDVFLHSHEKCVARHASSRKSSVKRAFFTSHVVENSKDLRSTPVVTTSRLSIAKNPTAKNKIVDSGCSKHMTRNLKVLRNFVEKFISTVRFENDHFTTITGYGDYVQGNLPICHMYYVEGLGHNLFLAGQFCDGDLEGESKKATLLLKFGPSTKSKLKLLHMDLCGSMHVVSINGKKYVLVIIDDYSRYTWVYFLRTKDEATDMIIDFVNQVQRNLKAQILMIQTDNGTELKNDKLVAFYAKADIGIFIGYSESSRGFHIYNRQTKKIIETIHVKFDELTAMASEYNNLEPEMNCTKFQDSSDDLQFIPSKSYLDNLFSPLYEEYYAMSS